MTALQRLRERLEAAENIPVGMCQCGCGAATPVAMRGHSALGHVKGQPVRFLPGHGSARPPIVRFAEKFRVDETTGCWVWTGSTRRGYGFFSIRWQSMPAHRFAYEALVGPIPEGLTIDHLCRNRACVNPAHLEPVTQRENNLRGDMPSAQNARKTHCKRGHPFDEANTRWLPGGRGRSCRTCARLDQRRYAAARRARSLEVRLAAQEDG